MINTLGKFREEMDGSRVPKYEVNFLAKKKIESKKKRKNDRQERKQKQAKEEAEKAADSNRNKQMMETKKKLGKGLSTLELLNSYQVNDYSVPEPTPKQNTTKVTFQDK